MREKKRSGPAPIARATSISGLLSIVKVARPSTSRGARPASPSAAITASHARRSSLRPGVLRELGLPDPGDRRAASPRRSSRAPGRKRWRTRSSSMRSNSTATGIPIATSSGATPTRRETSRVPSSSSTSTITLGYSKGGIGGCCATTKLCTVPRPLASIESISKRVAAGAHRRRRVLEPMAARAALDQQLVLRRVPPRRSGCRG